MPRRGLRPSRAQLRGLPAALIPESRAPANRDFADAHRDGFIRARSLPSLDPEWIGRRAYRAGDRDRRRDEHELVDLVGQAVLGQILEIEYLAHGHAHDRDGDPVPGLVDAAFGVVRPHLAAPSVARKRGQLGARDPLERLEGKAGRVAAGIAVPAAGLETTLHLAGPHDDVVTALDGHALRFCGVVEVLAG